MSYIEKNLMEGEQIIYEARQHWMIYWKPFVLLLIAIGLFAIPTSDVTLMGAEPLWRAQIHTDQPPTDPEAWLGASRVHRFGTASLRGREHFAKHHRPYAQLWHRDGVHRRGG